MSREVRSGLTKTKTKYVDGKITEVEPRLATVVDCLEAILDVASGLSRDDIAEIKLAFNREHRTNQQSFVRDVLVPILEALAANEDPRYHDARNAAAVKFAARVLDEAHAEPAGFRGAFPLI